MQDRYRERGQRPVDGSRQYENGSSEHYRSPSYDQRISQLQPHPPQYARNEESPPVRRNTDSTGNILHGPYAHHASQSTQSSHQSNYNNNLPSSSPSEFSLPDVRRKSNGQVVPPDILTTNPPRQLRPKAASTGRELPTPRQLTFQEVHTSRLEIGLENLGNTCFMNSMLQCLLHIEPLVSYFLLGKMEADLNPSSPKRGMIAASFHHLIQDVFNGKSGSAIAPVNFQRVVSMYAPYLMDFQQQDSQEFLRFLLDGMSEDLCRRKPCGNSQNHVQSASTDCPQNRAVAVRTPTKSGSPILPSLPHITSTTSPGTGGDGHPQTSSRVGSDGKASSIQRLRLETRSMRALDHTSPRQEPSSTGTGRASNQEEDVEPSGKDSHPPQPVLPSATFPGGAHHNKLRVLHDIQQSRLTNEEDIDHDGADVGIAANVEEEVAQSPREGAGGSSSSGRQTLSSQLRDVMTLRLRRTKPATEGSELSRTAPLVSADDSSVGGSGKDQHGSLSSRTVVVADSAVEAEAAVAWERYLKLNDSVITDIFGGLLQSTIECLTCHHRYVAIFPLSD